MMESEPMASEPKEIAAFDEQFPEQDYESGYLLINTTYNPDSSNGDSLEEPPAEEDPEAKILTDEEKMIEANACIAWAIRKIIEQQGGCVHGAVVERDVEAGDADKQPFYVLISLEVSKAVWGENPLRTIAELIKEELEGGLNVGSDIKVDGVETARKRDTDFNTGLQGPP